MKRDALCLFRNLYRANKAKSKVEILEDFMADFELLKLEIRMCVDLKLLPLKKDGGNIPFNGQYWEAGYFLA